MRITHEALTFDDVLLRPAYSEILPREVDLVTRLTRSLKLNIQAAGTEEASATIPANRLPNGGKRGRHDL